MISTAQTAAIDAVLDSYTAALEAGDRHAAVGTALTLMYRGVPGEAVLTALVGPGLVEVGRAWQEARWSIAQEHRATAISEAVIQAVALEGGMRQPSAASVPPIQSVPAPVAVASTEGEWHALPSRLVAEVLRLRGMEVSLLGPSVPSSDLAAFLDGEGIGVVAVSCSMPCSLVGAYRTITALRSVGTRIVCGGRGFGRDGRWARTLGADHWTGDLTQGADVIQRAAAGTRGYPRGPALGGAVVAQVDQAWARHPELVQAAIAEALARWPQLRTREHLVRATRDDLDFTLRALASCALVGDHALIEEYVRWFESVLKARRIPESLVAGALDILIRVIPPELNYVREAGQAGLAACSMQKPVVLPELRTINR